MVCSLLSFAHLSTAMLHLCQTAVLFTDGCSKLDSHWNKSKHTALSQVSVTSRRMQTLLCRCVSKQLITDSPLATELAGGVAHFLGPLMIGEALLLLKKSPASDSVLLHVATGGKYLLPSALYCPFTHHRGHKWAHVNKGGLFVWWKCLNEVESVCFIPHLIYCTKRL